MEQEILRKKSRYFFDKKIPIHIKRDDGRFFNGLILETEGDLIILDDEVLGPMPIYFLEITLLEKREEKPHGD